MVVSYCGGRAASTVRLSHCDSRGHSRAASCRVQAVAKAKDQPSRFFLLESKGEGERADKMVGAEENKTLARAGPAGGSAGEAGLAGCRPASRHGGGAAVPRSWAV